MEDEALSQSASPWPYPSFCCWHTLCSESCLFSEYIHTVLTELHYVLYQCYLGGNLCTLYYRVGRATGLGDWLWGSVLPGNLLIYRVLLQYNDVLFIYFLIGENSVTLKQQVKPSVHLETPIGSIRRVQAQQLEDIRGKIRKKKQTKKKTLSPNNVIQFDKNQWIKM